MSLVSRKMNFNAYVNRMNYPLKSDFSEEVEAVSKKGLTKTVKIFDEVGYRIAVQDYRDEEARIRRQFFKDLLEELDLTDHPKAAVLMEKAWEHGHSSGFEEVANWAYDLAELMT